MKDKKSPSNKKPTTFSLKDQLFNPKKIKQLSSELSSAYKNFDSSGFEKAVLLNFSQLELKQRISRIADCLESFLPEDIETAIDIIIKALPESCDPSKEDQDFGDFIYEPYNLYIARKTCNKQFLKFGFQALEQTTQRFSAEFALRFFMREFEAETLLQVKKWTKHKHYHVRRLASEGIRPALPWGGKINTDPSKIIAILDLLYADQTRFVTRSVANSLNDISKLDLNLLLKTLKRWQQEQLQAESELNYIIKHALRTQIKLGDPAVLKFLGYNSGAKWKIDKLRLPKNVKIGGYLDFEFEIDLAAKSEYIIDYVIHFNGKGTKASSKVFKLKKVSTDRKTKVVIRKKHAFKIMTTKRLYSGQHALAIQVNGIRSDVEYFELL